MEKTEKKIKIALSCSPAFRDRLKQYADEKGLSMSTVMVFAVDRWIQSDLFTDLDPKKKK